MLKIVRLGLFTSDQNFEREFTFENKLFTIESIGTDGDIKKLKQLAIEYDGQCDAICISNLPHKLTINGKQYIHPIFEDIQNTARLTPIIDGHKLREIYYPWSIRRIAEDYPDLIKNRKIGFPAGLVHYNYLDDIYEHSDQLYFADPYFIFGVPKILKSKKSLETFIKTTYPLIKKHVSKKMMQRDFSQKKFSENRLLKNLAKCDVYFCNQTQFDYLVFDKLEGKTIITDFLTKKQEKMLKDSGVRSIISCFPRIEDLPFYGFTILEAVITLLQKDKKEIQANSIFDFIRKYNLTPSFKNLGKNISNEQTRRCAFVIHPLSKNHLLSIPLIGFVKKSKTLVNLIEKSMPLTPGVAYGQVKGIKSAHNGVEVICDLFAVLETPKMLLKSDKNRIYKKLVNIAYKAELKGSKILGLGAYTKIVGDAGVTVNKRSPIPVTTGNSLSAASTLWAADFAIKKMELINVEDDLYHGCVMIIGATGSIGKVCAKILSHNWKRVIISAPREYKLMDLAEELKGLNPKCIVDYTTTPEEFSSHCDLIITTTSAQGRKILDIQSVKPGCVICDVSRPFDISKEDALSRPDVLVIASGEVELPGYVSVSTDIGLTGSTVYACLAETVLLTLEGKYESFSLSRDLSYKKVTEIDKLARKHGVKLSAIMGHDAEITLEEIQMCKDRAIEARKSKS